MDDNEKQIEELSEKTVNSKLNLKIIDLWALGIAVVIGGIDVHRLYLYMDDFLLIKVRFSQDIQCSAYVSDHCVTMRYLLIC